MEAYVKFHAYIKAFCLFFRFYAFLPCYYVFLPFTIYMVLFPIGRTTEKKKLRYHKLLYNMANIMDAISIPGVKFRFNNLVGEKFDKPAVIISNHLKSSQHVMPYDGVMP